jgi:hypothetical protein
MTDCEVLLRLEDDLEERFTWELAEKTRLVNLPRRSRHWEPL